MKNRKLLLLTILAVIVLTIVLMFVFVPSLKSEKGDTEINPNVDSSLPNELSKAETIMSDTTYENNANVTALSELSNYYHSVSDADESSVYLGGAGGIYRIGSEYEVQTLYSAPNVAGAALYGDYIFSLEYNITDEGMTTELIRINRKNYDKEVITQVSSGNYDLRIIDNTLILSEAIIGDYGLETVFRAYNLNAEGNLTSDTPEDAYSQFGLPDGYTEGMHFLINPWFSMKYFGYSCFVKTAGETDINSIWIRKEDQEAAKEVVACSGEPLITKDRIFYCNGDGKSLMQRVWDNSQETMLYEIPEGSNLLLLTYDAEWVYFLQTPNIDESNKLPLTIMRVNIQDHRTEEIYKLQTGDSISNFNVYGNNCYFILSGTDNSNRWECRNLTDFTITTTVTESSQNSEKSDMLESLKITINLTEHYITHIGDPGNFYYIDDNNVLWGSGRNEYGQLGQGTQDYEFYSEGLKIAENVVHVDYSQKGFVIFLTNDHKLYGVGNAGGGALGQYEKFDWTRYINGEDYVVTKPILLMENVAYASCGRDDVVCLKNDGTVWNWGTVYAMNYMSNNVYYIAAPKKILDHAVLVTGGWFNHAALLQDGTVWTWGYNNAGNCGVADFSVVKEPTMVAEDVTMVWTNLAMNNYPQPKTEQIKMVWTGDIKYDTEYESIIELGDVYPYHLNNTVIQKTDGSYWVCGENVGTEENVVHGAEGDYSIICTYEFYMYE